MKQTEFEAKVIELGYKSEYGEYGVYGGADLPCLFISHASGEWNNFIVARVVLDEHYNVVYDYATPFGKELYDCVYDFISTPLNER